MMRPRFEVEMGREAQRTRGGGDGKRDATSGGSARQVREEPSAPHAAKTELLQANSPTAASLREDSDSDNDTRRHTTIPTTWVVSLHCGSLDASHGLIPLGALERARGQGVCNANLRFAVDLDRHHVKSGHRKAPKSDNPYLTLLHKLYS